jgi:hypothetical protein
LLLSVFKAPCLDESRFSLQTAFPQQCNYDVFTSGIEMRDGYMGKYLMAEKQPRNHAFAYVLAQPWIFTGENPGGGSIAAPTMLIGMKPGG